MSESNKTPEKWGWFGNAKYGEFYLAEIREGGGRHLVMDFVRCGMQGAQPRFPVNGMIEEAKNLAIFEVAPDVVGIGKANEEGSGVYRHDIIGFDNPYARMIQEAPETAAERDAMRENMKRLQSERDALLDKLKTIMVKLGCSDKTCAAIDACGPDSCDREACLWYDLHTAVAAAEGEVWP